MPTGDVFVSIDQGGHATRAVAFDARGTPLASAFAGLSTRREPGGHVEHDGEELIASVRGALNGLAAQVPAIRWRGAGLAVQRSTIACWDRERGTVLGPVISWQDRRQAGWLESLSASAARVHGLTGLPLSPHYGASKLRWCLEHVDAVRAAAEEARLCAGPLASLLLNRMLEEQPALSDEANASRTQLFSPVRRAWLPELLELFGVPEAVLPGLAPTESRFGTLLAGGRRVPLLVCTGDQAAAPFAGGALDPDAVHVNLGTGAFMLRATARAVVAPPLLTSVLRSDTDSVDFVLEGTVNGAGSAIDWFARQQGLSPEGLLAGLEQTRPVAGDAPLFLNGVSGVGSPFWDADLRPRFVGAGGVAERFRAVVESIAFLLRANFDELARHAGRPARIIASGGLSRSDFLCGAIGSLSGLPLQRRDDPEATARGVAFLAAGQPLDWRVSRCVESEPVRDEALEARYLRWLDLMRAATAGADP